MALLRVNVDNPGDKITEFGLGAKLYWERDNTSATGSFADATGSVVLDPDVTQYEIVDATGQVGHWYRTRIGTSLGAPFDEYGPVFQGGAVGAYATLDALREYVENPDNSKDNMLSDLLVQASASLDRKCRRDFFRHPQLTGTETRTFDGDGAARLFVRAGIVSLTSVGLAQLTGGSYTTLAGSDWFLQPDQPVDSYDSVVLSDQSGWVEPVAYGRRTWQLTGVFGFAAIPEDVVKATLDLAREWYRQGPGGGSPVGLNQFGTPLFLQGAPTTVRDVVENYARRTLVR